MELLGKSETVSTVQTISTVLCTKYRCCCVSQ